MHVVDFLRLSKWCNIRGSEGYFVAKCNCCVRFANVFAFFTSMHTHVWFISSFKTCSGVVVVKLHHIQYKV